MGFELAHLLAAGAVSVALNSLCLGALLVLLATAILRLLPGSNAATRYAVWFVTLALVLASPAMLLLPRPVVMPAARIAPEAAPVEVPVTAHWPTYLVLIWLAIAILLLGRIIWSLLHIQGLKRRAILLGRRGNVRVLASEEVRVPMAAGFWRPAIVFPPSVTKELSRAEFEQVLAHELAHLRRGDDWTQLVDQMARAVLFFNPAVYWIGRHLAIEREMACDDWVVSATGEARPYAACLARLYELTCGARSPAVQLAPGATTRKRWQISARVEALLSPKRSSTPRASRSGWVAACALACAALLVTARTAPPVGIGELPAPTLSLASLHAPSPPVLAWVAPRAAPAKPHLAARRSVPVPPTTVDGPVVLVREWRGNSTPTYFVITVVFFEPPPHAVINGT